MMMSGHLLHLIADRALNRPLLISPQKAQVILSVLGGRIGVAAPEASRFEGEWESGADKKGRARTKPYKVAEGVAIITIVGSLVNRGAWIGASSGLTSYEGIGHQLKTALADDAVHSVILDLHSPGGEAVGAFETAAMVRALAAKKRTIAVVNGMAASAAYAIASGATEIVTTETGISGSIGVVLLHADYSRNLDREGITPTLIHAGAHKVDGNPFEPLSDEIKADLQAEVDGFYSAFLSAVAEGRGRRLTAAAARKTEARAMIGQAAVDAGLADRLGTFESALADLTGDKNRPSSTPAKRNAAMSARNTPSAADERPDYEAGYAAGYAAANERIATVINAEGVKGRPAKISAALELLTEDANMAPATIIKIVDKYAPHGGPSGVASLANRPVSESLGNGVDQTAGAGRAGSLLALAKQRYGDEKQQPAKGGRLMDLARRTYGDGDDAA